MSGASLLKTVRPELAGSFFNKEYLFGRNAIYAALTTCEKMGHKRIWLPTYSCGDEIAVANQLGFDLMFYEVNSFPHLGLVIDPRQVQSDDIVLLVHFFGCVDSCKNTRQTIEAIKAKGCIIIEDAAYALFSKDVGVVGDFIIFSLRKALPVPHGAILCYKNNFDLQEAITPTEDLITCEINNFENCQKIKKIGTGYHAGIDRNNIYGARYKKFGGYKLGCSDYISNVLDDINLTKYKASSASKFKKIYQLLSNGLGDEKLSVAKVMIDKSVHSQFLPIIVKNSSCIYKASQKEKLYFVLPFWNRMHPFVDWNKHDESKAMKNQVVALHLGYPINNEDLYKLSDIILQKEESI